MIWCVEDDASIRDIAVYALNSTGLKAQGFSDGLSFWETLQKEQPELVLLDVMLPGIDGVTLLENMKKSPKLQNIPVIMATAKGSEFDKIRCLDIGADDYLVKPYGMMEMVSRVKAVLRRFRPQQPTLLQYQGLTLDTQSYVATADGERLHLTFREFSLLRQLMRNPGTAFSREQLLKDVWETDFLGETRTVDMHIRTLRQKLGKYGNCIETVRNVGYRLSIK